MANTYKNSVALAFALGAAGLSYATVTNAIDPMTGGVGAPADVGVIAEPLADFEPQAPIAGALYGTDGSNLYTIDTMTGAATLVGPHGSVANAIGALAFDSDGNLFGIDLGTTAQLYQIDPATGAASAIGPMSIGFVFEGGLAFVGGELFGADQGDVVVANTFTVNTVTGLATVIGGAQSRDINGMTFGDGTLYAIDRVSNSLGTVNTTTGEYTIIGSTGAVVGASGGLAFDPTDATLYATFDDGGFYELDKNTGAATQIGTNGVDFGLAFAPGGANPDCDVNGDGAFSFGDVITFQRGCADGSAEWMCDINGDGVFSFGDTVRFFLNCRN